MPNTHTLHTTTNAHTLHSLSTYQVVNVNSCGGFSPGNGPTGTTNIHTLHTTLMLCILQPTLIPCFRSLPTKLSMWNSCERFHLYDQHSYLAQFNTHTLLSLTTHQAVNVILLSEVPLAQPTLINSTVQHSCLPSLTTKLSMWNSWEGFSPRRGLTGTTNTHTWQVHSSTLTPCFHSVPTKLSMWNSWEGFSPRRGLTSTTNTHTWHSSTLIPCFHSVPTKLSMWNSWEGFSPRRGPTGTESSSVSPAASSFCCRRICRAFRTSMSSITTTSGQSSISVGHSQDTQ